MTQNRTHAQIRTELLKQLKAERQTPNLDAKIPLRHLEYLASRYGIEGPMGIVEEGTSKASFRRVANIVANRANSGWTGLSGNTTPQKLSSLGKSYVDYSVEISKYFNPGVLMMLGMGAAGLIATAVVATPIALVGGVGFGFYTGGQKINALYQKTKTYIKEELKPARARWNLTNLVSEFIHPAREFAVSELTLEQIDKIKPILSSRNIVPSSATVLNHFAYRLFVIPEVSRAYAKMIETSATKEEKDAAEKIFYNLASGQVSLVSSLETYYARRATQKEYDFSKTVDETVLRASSVWSQLSAFIPRHDRGRPGLSNNELVVLDSLANNKVFQEGKLSSLAGFRIRRTLILEAEADAVDAIVKANEVASIDKANAEKAKERAEKFEVIVKDLLALDSSGKASIAKLCEITPTDLADQVIFEGILRSVSLEELEVIKEFGLLNPIPDDAGVKVYLQKLRDAKPVGAPDRTWDAQNTPPVPQGSVI